MIKKVFLFSFLFGFCIAAEKPNVIVILTDDQGWGDLSSNGNKDLSTPNVDSLGKDGAVFDSFYVQPVCAPTRAEFLTGRYHGRSSVSGVSKGAERMDLDETTIADTFRAAGYKTAAFGKWHNGMQYPYHPIARGFDEYYGFCSGHWGNYYSPMLDHNNRITKGDGYIIDDLTNKAMSYIEKNKNEPFFVFLPYCTPHSPMQVPDQWWNKFKDKKMQMKHEDKSTHVRAALAMCENIDYNVGRLLKKLDELKLDENTIILYFSDNGPNGKRWNNGLKGKKGSVDEGGVLSPLLMRWKGTIKPGTQIKPISGAIDLLPTLTDLCGVKLSGTKPLDGISMKKAILNKSINFPDRYIYNKWSKGASIRNQKYRLSGKQLFDIENDPQQKKDLSKKLPEVVTLMKAEQLKLEKSIAAEMQGGRPFVITSPGGDFFQIPARDAHFTKGIRRSAKAPNCSFLTSWTDTKDYIYWPALAQVDGKYEVEVYYTCKKEDVGVKLGVSFNGEKISKQVTEVNEPPLFGMKQDHFKRKSESYVKEFKVLKMGVLTMKKGEGELKLEALSKAGQDIIEFRLLTLKKVD